MEQHQQQQQRDTSAPNGNNVDHITSRFDGMNVNIVDDYDTINLSPINNNENVLGQHPQQGTPFPAQQQQQQQFNNFNNDNVIHLNNRQVNYLHSCHEPMDEDHQMIHPDYTETSLQHITQQQHNQQQLGRKMSNILIITNVDSSVFGDKLVKAKFESLFTAYDQNVTFRYLKSFRRVRLDFVSPHLADQARVNLDNYKLGKCVFKCYLAQMIQPNKNNSGSLDNDQDDGSDDGGHSTANAFLNIPKPSKQFLISPPASPPAGWRPREEAEPCIDVQLISALSNLVPGKVHEIHAGNESQPGIFVEVCEEVQFETQPHQSNQMTRGCPRIPKTMSPATFQMRR